MKTTIIILALIVAPLSGDIHSHKHCKITDQNGEYMPDYCKANPEKRKLCYADTKYEDGCEFRVWGNECVEQYQDCFWNKPTAVKPIGCD